MTSTKQAGHNLSTVESTVASMLMYIECLICVGHTFEDAKAMAIARTIFVGEAATFRPVIVAAIDRVSPEHLSRSGRLMLVEAAYIMAIEIGGLRDTALRRCVFRWFGLLI